MDTLFGNVRENTKARYKLHYRGFKFLGDFVDRLKGVLKVGWRPSRPPVAPHWDTLYGKQCYGRKLWIEERQHGNFVEVTEQCEKCKQLFFQQLTK